ncbi:MAG: sodium:proton antiporter, partial [bacterium]
MAQRIPGARWFAAGLLPLASPAAAAGLDGAALGLLWALPFAGMLLSIALVPLASLRLWHHHYGKIAVGWALATLVPLALVFGPATALDVALHTLVQEYVPFMVFIGALYVVAGGIFVRGNLHGGPLLNTGLLGLGAALASVMGTTG